MPEQRPKQPVSGHSRAKPNWQLRSHNFLVLTIMVDNAQSISCLHTGLVALILIVQGQRSKDCTKLWWRTNRPATGKDDSVSCFKKWKSNIFVLIYFVQSEKPLCNNFFLFLQRYERDLPWDLLFMKPVWLSDPNRSDLEDPFIVLLLVLVMLGPTSRILSNYSLPMLRRPP